jgi:tetratricopeptide (TPR) repeat protein
VALEGGVRGLFVLLVGVVAFCASAVRAEDAAEPPGYRETVEQALSEYSLHNYEEASALFSRAHEIYPNARTLRGMGMASFELRRYEESANNLEAALRSKVRPLEGELRSETESLLARARGFLAVVKVEVQPTTATLLLDGQPVQTNELNLRLGEHTLEVRAQDYRPETRTVRVHGGEVLHIDISLDRNTLASGPVERPRPLYKNAWLWTGVGLVIAGGVVAGVLLATRDHQTKIVPNDTANSLPGVSLSTLGMR